MADQPNRNSAQSLEAQFKDAGKNVTKRMTKKQLAALAEALIEQRNAAQGQVTGLQQQLTVALQNATIDPLTQTLNRRGYEAELRQQIATLDRTGETFGLLFTDFNDFKETNNKYSHAGGDACLKDAGRVLKQAVRGTDTVGRFGGEEFVGIFPNVNKTEAMAAAGHVSKTFHNSAWEWAGEKIPHNATVVLLVVEKGDIQYRTGTPARNSNREINYDATIEKLNQRVSEKLKVAKAYKYDPHMRGHVHLVEPSGTKPVAGVAKPAAKTAIPGGGQTPT